MTEFEDEGANTKILKIISKKCREGREVPCVSISRMSCYRVPGPAGRGMRSTCLMFKIII